MTLSVTAFYGAIEFGAFFLQRIMVQLDPPDNRKVVPNPNHA